MTPAEAWSAHVSACKRCAQVKIEKPATLALASLEGSRLFKELANQQYLALSMERARGARIGR